MHTGGFSRARLQRMRAVMAGYVERGEVPGLVTLISRRGEVQVDVLGNQAAGRSEPMRRDTIFRISSMTKPITAVAAMILVEECRLRLDEPVDRLLPELQQRRVLTQIDGPLTQSVPARRPITLRDLLTFRMGFGLLQLPAESTPILRAAHDARIGMGPPNPQSLPEPDEWMRRLGALPLMYQPGERWLYNTGADVLGVLIARAAAQPFERFVRERIFEPLGMKDTAFSVPADAIGRLATSYMYDHRNGELDLFDPARDGQWSRPPAFASGAAGLCSTLDDYFAFAQMLNNKGRYPGGRILSRPSVETMTTDQLTAQQKSISGSLPGTFNSHGWGFGVLVTTRREQLWQNLGVYGWDGGLGTSWRNDPREDMTTILLAQCAWVAPEPPLLCHDFWNSAYQAIDD